MGNQSQMETRTLTRATTTRAPLDLLQRVCGVHTMGVGGCAECGESFTRPRGTPNAPPQFGERFDPASREVLIREGRADMADDTWLDERQSAREQFFPKEARRFRVSDRIP
jgi:hypothetical protein